MNRYEMTRLLYDKEVPATRPQCVQYLHNTWPAAWPEEFEIITKTMINRKGSTYLEWGTGVSSQWYPTLVSGQVIALDNYPQWCDEVRGNPMVKCLTEKYDFHLHCIQFPKRADGSEMSLGQWGYVSPEDVLPAGRAYTDSIDLVMADRDFKVFDVIMVDGRWRPACAIKVLNYMNEDSVLIIHDFWPRESYWKVLEYFEVIGRARTVVVLKAKVEVMKWDNVSTLYTHFLGSVD